MFNQLVRRGESRLTALTYSILVSSGSVHISLCAHFSLASHHQDASHRNTIVALHCVASSFGLVAADDKNFNQTGYPIIMVVGAVLFVVAAALKAKKHGSLFGYKNHLFFFIMNLILLFAGICLILGPDEGGIRAPIIGLMLCMQFCLGLLIWSTNSHALRKAYALFGMFNLLSLFGVHNLFGFSSAIWRFDTAGCNAYFVELGLNRCKTDGYLQFLRVLGCVAILSLFFSTAECLFGWIEPLLQLDHASGAHKSGAAAGVHTTTTTTVTGVVSGHHHTGGVAQPLYDQVQVAERPVVHSPI